MMRTELLERIKTKVSAGQPVSVSVARLNGNAFANLTHTADLTFVYHTSRSPELKEIFGLLPFADANAAVLEITHTGLPQDKALIAGVCGTDPFRLLDKFLEEIKSAGFVGVQNFPTLGLMDGAFRGHLEERQIGYTKEVEMIRVASQIGLLTMPLVFTTEEALQMADAGADILVIHPGAKAFRKQIDLNGFARSAEKMAERAVTVRKEILTLRYSTDNELVGAR